MNPIRQVIHAVLNNLPTDERLLTIPLRPAYREWKKRYLTPGVPHFPSRELLWDHLISDHLKTPVVYLEFGVFRGYSIRYFSEHISDADSVFVGFDTFTGLPENWSTTPAGDFGVNGVLPQIDDPRVSFRKGLFQDTLPSFLETQPIRGSLFINCDADLYTSTLFVLTQLWKHLDGAIVYFDEFGCLPHEFRALEDFSRSYRIAYEVLGAATNIYQPVAIRFHRT